MSRKLVSRGRAGDQLVLLHYAGRRSGRRFDVPVGYHLVDGVVSVFTNSGWRHNFAGGRDTDVTFKGVRQSAHVVLCDDPGEVTDIYQRLIQELGMAQAARRQKARGTARFGWFHRDHLPGIGEPQVGAVSRQ